MNMPKEQGYNIKNCLSSEFSHNERLHVIPMHSMQLLILTVFLLKFFDLLFLSYLFIQLIDKNPVGNVLISDPHHSNRN